MLFRSAPLSVPRAPFSVLRYPSPVMRSQYSQSPSYGDRSTYARRSPLSSSIGASESRERSSGYRSPSVPMPLAPPLPGSGGQNVVLPPMSLDQDTKDILLGTVDWLDQPVHHSIVSAWNDLNSVETKFIHEHWQSESEIPTWIRALWSDGKPIPFHLSKQYFDQIDPHFIFAGTSRIPTESIIEIHRCGFMTSFFARKACQRSFWTDRILQLGC